MLTFRIQNNQYSLGKGFICDKNGRDFKFTSSKCPCSVRRKKGKLHGLMHKFSLKSLYQKNVLLMKNTGRSEYHFLL